MQDRRHKFIPFESESIRGFLGSFESELPVVIMRHEPFAEGASNSSDRVWLSSGQDYVVRRHARGDPASEQAVKRLLPPGVSAPRTHWVGTHEGVRISVLEYLPGVSLQEAGVSPVIMSDAGRCLGQMSRVRFPTPGLIADHGGIEPFPWGGLLDWLERQMSSPEVAHWLDEGRMARLRRCVGAYEEVLRAFSADASLVHGDFNPSNLLVRDGRLVGVVDWEFAHAGTPMMDIGNLLRHVEDHPDRAGLEQGLRAGFEEAGSRLPDDWCDRAALCDLCSHLEFLGSKRSDAFKRSRVLLIEKLCCRLGVD